MPIRKNKNPILPRNEDPVYLATKREVDRKLKAEEKKGKK
jgi:hypothetical protein